MKVVIAPKKMHLSLLNELRRDDPFLDVKLYSKEALSRSVFPLINNESLLYLMKEHHYSYEVSKMLLEYLPYVNEKGNYNINNLLEIKKELNEHSLLANPLPLEIEDKNVTVIGYSEYDFELKELLKHFDLNAEYISNPRNEEVRQLNIFEKMEDEVYFVLNRIASLIKQSEPIKNIYILRRNSEYDYYLKKFAPLFGYQINLNSSEPLSSTGGVKEFLKLLSENKDIKSSLELLKEKMKDDPLYLEVEDVVNNNVLEDADFEIQFDYLINKFKEKRRKSPRYVKAVEVIDGPIYQSNKSIFVLGFAQGNYPNSYKDDKYLNNEELQAINRLNSKDKTKIDESLLIDFFNSNNSFYYSYCKRSASKANQYSPISIKLGYQKVYPHLDNIFYSSKILKYIYSNLKDLDYFYKERGEDFFKIRDAISLEYNSYSNAYDFKANAFDENSFLSLSTTALELYSSCPFHYYLDRVIKLDEQESTYALSLGILAHHMFEHFNDAGFDFDKVYDAKLAEYSLKESERYLLNHNLKEQIRTAVNAIKLRSNYYTNPDFHSEIELQYKLDEKTKIVGKIDSLIVIDNTYFVCIDYKTGSTKFDDSKLSSGLSTQLPTYACLTMSDKRFSDYSLAGLYINNVLSNSIKNESKEDELIPSYLKLNGKTLGDIKVVEKIDSTIADFKSSFVSGVSLKKDGCSLRDTNAIATGFDFENYVTTVVDLYRNMASKIRNNCFDISPYFISDRDNACSYCPYKDVCYVRDKQFRLIKKEDSSDEVLK